MQTISKGFGDKKFVGLKTFITNMKLICTIYMLMKLLPLYHFSFSCSLSQNVESLGLLQEQYEIFKIQDNKVKQDIWEHEECDNVIRMLCQNENNEEGFLMAP